MAGTARRVRERRDEFPKLVQHADDAILHALPESLVGEEINRKGNGLRMAEPGGLLELGSERLGLRCLSTPLACALHTNTHLPPDTPESQFLSDSASHKARPRSDPVCHLCRDGALLSAAILTAAEAELPVVGLPI
jgi:hypothetical protein